MWVKICGNTRLEDCLRAAELGADAVGFVFAPFSKRRVTAEQVRAMTRELPAELGKIGVFSMMGADEVLRTASEAGLTGVQLHTAVVLPELLSQVRARFGGDSLQPAVIQVVHRWVDHMDEKQEASFTAAMQTAAEAGADAVLVDSRSEYGSGGMGKTFDWAAARPALSGVSMPVIVAGGLTPENVGDAVNVLRPWGVDVSSGVEMSPGVKDAVKVKAFIRNARGG